MWNLHLNSWTKDSLIKGFLFLQCEEGAFSFLIDQIGKENVYLVARAPIAKLVVRDLVNRYGMCCLPDGMSGLWEGEQYFYSHLLE
jgi:hypothetical protein